MDPVLNPYAPGAGTPPAELAGRDELRELARVAMERVRRGMPTKSVPMVGLRGVGKTMLLDRVREDAESRGRMGKAKSYAERLFDFPEVGPLPPDAARIAIVRPATAQGVTIEEDTVQRIVEETKDYPYFLQEWGKHAWNAAGR